MSSYLAVYLGPTLRQKCVFSQLLLLDPEQLLKLISIEILLILAPEQRRKRPGRAAVLSGTRLAPRPGACTAPSQRGKYRLALCLHGKAAAGGLARLWYSSAPGFVPGFAS